jgi:murein DD-endopeptidase MepM/ murein hydrolase activator NlpD
LRRKMNEQDLALIRIKKQRMLRTVLIWVMLAGCLWVSFSFIRNGGNEEDSPRTRKDTIQALVINDNTSLLESISTLTGEEIFGMIDSLLDADAIPVELIKEINDYAESRLLEHDYYVSLTTYYDDSPIPANNLYQSWNTQSIYPYDENLTKDDSSMILVLEDKENLCNFVMPVDGPVTSNFGWREGRNHNGMDIDLQVWDPVVASFDGMVRIAKAHGGYGRVVVIRHYNGLETLYAHLHRIKVKPGDVVEAGQVIGLGGSSGRSTGSHLHYEMRFKGKPLNPRHLISFRNNELLNDSIVITKTKWSYSAYPVGTQFHVVQRGDFLYAIAKRYGTSVNRICQLNGIRRNATLREGHKLKIVDVAQR